ncbi:MAG TPA: nicotinate-nucleotide adenylyltransferase [Actinomycetota bacterium]|nr:nicotinate-nucleotide adenylyltransferase [Actinomycetota bacterium]
MGGTFDPIHHGHLLAAEEARHAFSLDKVLFVPAGNPWQKDDKDVTPGEQRLEMTKLATDGNPSFEVSRLELDREGPTYTIDTLRAVREQQPDDELFFITGADAISQILTWKDPSDVLDLATFVAVTRPGHRLDDAGSQGAGERIVVLEIPALAISSTDIRRRVAEGRPIRYLVPDAVARYIADHGLYKT